jgi:hypothetical protein
MMNKLIFLVVFNGTQCFVLVFISPQALKSREVQFKVHRETLQYFEDDHHNQLLLNQQKCHSC